MDPMRVLRPVLLMLMLMFTSVVQVYSQPPPPPPLAGIEGNADLVWHYATTGQVMTWQMHGTTIAQSAVVAQVSDLGWQIAGIGDIDRDGKADLVWHYATTGQVMTWQMHGLKIKQTVSSPR
jgi:hypothetical protein